MEQVSSIIRISRTEQLRFEQHNLQDYIKRQLMHRLADELMNSDKGLIDITERENVFEGYKEYIMKVNVLSEEERRYIKHLERENMELKIRSRRPPLIIRDEIDSAVGISEDDRLRRLENEERADRLLRQFTTENIDELLRNAPIIPFAPD